MTTNAPSNGNAGPEKPIAPEELEKAKKLQDALASIKENPDSETIAEALNDSLRTEGDLSEKELRQLKLQIEGALAKVDATLSVPEHLLTNDGMVQLAISSGLLNPSEYRSLILESAQDKKDGKKGNASETVSSGKSIQDLDQQYQDAKSQFLRARSPSERRMYTVQMRQIRKTIEDQLGYNYSLYRHELRDAKERHRQEVTDVYYDEEGNHHQYNRETGSHVVGHARRPEEPGVSTDELADAKYRLDRGIGRGGRRLPQNRYNRDGRVNFFTEGDRQEVQDFINARASRRLARLEQMESFAAQRADIMDVLTNPDRFEREFQKIKEAPIDYSAPGVMERARKNNVVHYLLSKDHTMVHDVANEPPTRAEIEALRRDAIFRDSWNKVDRRSENMMNFDQFITFRQTGWEDRDTEKFIPSMTKDGFVKDYAYIFHKNSRQEELVINPKGEIVAHRWQKPLSDGKIMIAETRFGRPKGSPLKVSRVDFQKTWKNGVPGKLALRDHDGKSLPENFTIDLSKFPRDGRGMMIGNVAWIERDGNSAFNILFMKEGNYDLHALEATSKQRKHALVAVTKGSEKQQTA